MLSGAPTQSPRRALELLSGLRGRLRGACLADGLLALALGIAGAAAASFVLDYFLLLPRGVRLVFLAAGAVALAACVRRLADLLARPLGDADLAGLVERANPELAQSLVTAVELTRPGSETAAYVSPALLAAVVRGVEERAASLRLDGIVDLGRIRRRGLSLGVAALALGSAAFLEPELAALWLRRNALLSAAPWPKLTELALVAPDPAVQPALVAMGDDLEVAVRVDRGSPRAVVLRSSGPGGQVLRSEILVPAAASGLYRTLLENVSRPFRFTVAGGDDEIGPFEVDVRLRPRIDSQSMEIWCEYPPYTRLESTPEAQPLRFGNLKVPQGTLVRYRMAANVAIRKAFFVFREAQAAGSQGSAGAPPSQDAWPDPGAVELPVEESRRFAGDFTVAASGQYYFQLEGADGFRSRRPDRFRVDAVPDQKPAVKILEPERITEEVTAEALVPVRVAASDDYGLQRAAVEARYFPPEKDTGAAQSFDLPRLAAPAGEGPGAGAPAGAPGAARPGTSRQPLEDEVLIKVAALETGGAGPPVPGGRLQYYALASDHAGHVGESDVRYLQVVEKEDLLRILNDQLMVVRDQLREALRKQRSARKDLEDFHRQIALLEKVVPSEAQKLFRHRQEQGRVTQGLDREARELTRLLARATRNKVGDEKWRGWVGGVRDDLEELGKRRSPAVEGLIERLQKESAESPPPVSRLGVIEAEQRALEKEIESLVLRLTEFGDVNALIQMLRELRRRQDDLREETRSQIRGPSPREPQK
ncbi:MAG: hypothetical protein HY721_10830 [Planctomycetes bacterium]|nr:hypothetical protein [Planctomycetota bacterium]